LELFKKLFKALSLKNGGIMGGKFGHEGLERNMLFDGLANTA
jgi:hypothetical protein